MEIKTSELGRGEIFVVNFIPPCQFAIGGSIVFVWSQLDGGLNSQCVFFIWETTQRNSGYNLMGNNPPLRSYSLIRNINTP